MALATGSLLAGRYEILSAIATGGMGEVWRARDRVLDRVVAAKVLRSEYTGDPSFLARFRNEARHTAALGHPNIASIYDYGETTDETGTQQLAFLVMEFVEGQPLVTILHDEGRLPVDWTLHVLEQSAEGLSAAHRAGVVHRDIKPGNLLIRPDGVVKLTDFGIAQARDATPLTKTGMVVGTAQYLSPEQAQGMEVTAASDVYSLGVVAYECLAGVRPFDGASQVAIALAHINRPPPPLPADVPPAVRLLVERALAKDPADRFSDGGAFADALHRVASGGSLAGGIRPAGAAAPLTAPTRVVDMSDGHTSVLPATGAAAAARPATGGRPLPPLHVDDDRAAHRPGPRADDGFDDGLDDGAAPDADRRRRRVLWITLAGLLALLVGLGAWLLSGDDAPSGNEAPPTSAAPSAPTSAGSVLFDPGNYVGRPVDDVAAALEGVGLSVTTEPASTEQLAAAAADGTVLAARDVAATDPAVAVPVERGEDVVLYFAQAAYPPVVETTEVPRTTSPAPSSTSETPASTTATTSSAATSTSAAPSSSAPVETTEPTTEPPASGTVEPSEAPATPTETAPATTAGAVATDGTTG